jgi:hypothetical protein
MEWNGMEWNVMELRGDERFRLIWGGGKERNGMGWGGWGDRWEEWSVRGRANRSVGGRLSID